MKIRQKKPVHREHLRCPQTIQHLVGKSINVKKSDDILRIFVKTYTCLTFINPGKCEVD